MIRGDGWSERWHVVAPEGAERLDVPAGWRARRALIRRLRAVPAGTWIVLCDATPGSRRRIRRVSREAGMLLGREYLAFPSPREAAYLVEDARDPVAYFWTALLRVPPGGPAGWLVGQAGVSAVHRLRAWDLVRAAVPGRLAVAWRP
jgi:hypothetical protein